MEKKPISLHGLSLKTIVNQKKRSAYILAIVALLSFALFGGSLLMDGAEKGMLNTAQRLGADLMVIPRGYDGMLTGVLLRSEPSTFYFHGAEILGTIDGIPGVERTSAQLFLQSLDAACCSVPVQLIAFDAGTDFTIQPWIAASLAGEALSEGDVLVGSLVEAIPGDQILLFGQNFRVAGRLDKTGSGFDSSIFMESHTAQTMITLARTQAASTGVEDANAVSCVMVKVEEGYAADDVARAILHAAPDAEVVATEGVLGEVSKNLGMFSLLIRFILIGVWIVAALLMAALFSFSIYMRRREFGMLRMIGSTRGRLAGMVIAEAGLLCFLGALLGCTLGCLVLFPFQTLIAASIDFPYVLPDFGRIVRFALFSLLVGTLTGPLACLGASIGIGKSETFLLIRD